MERYVLARCSSSLLWLILLIYTFPAFADRAEAEETLVSWYDRGLYGQLTASSDPYDARMVIGQRNKTLSLGAKLVRYKGRSVAVTLNDRKPYVGDRVLDLSEGVTCKSWGLNQASVDYVEYGFADGSSYGARYPAPHVAVDARAYTVQ